MLALNHGQIKKFTTGQYILADKSKFEDTANWLLNIKAETLTDVIQKLKTSPVRPNTDNEKAHFKVPNDLDHVAYKVQKSITCKKYMRNEGWSLVAYYYGLLHLHLLISSTQRLCTMQILINLLYPSLGIKINTNWLPITLWQVPDFYEL